MKKIVAGILAHVDAGKTTLAEAMLYRTGKLRKIGRVDHGDTALDTHTLERERGITIFASQAVFSTDKSRLHCLIRPVTLIFPPRRREHSPCSIMLFLSSADLTVCSRTL